MLEIIAMTLLKKTYYIIVWANLKIFLRLAHADKNLWMIVHAANT